MNRFKCVHQSAGWAVIDISTSLPAVLGRAAQIDLAEPLATPVTNGLNAFGRYRRPASQHEEVTDDASLTTATTAPS